jgi:hypothetical protein
MLLILTRRTVHKKQTGKYPKVSLPLNLPISNASTDIVDAWTGGLPDFSWFNKPKRGKDIQNYHKIYQVATKYTQRL